MPLHRDKRPCTEHPFVGMWHITGMEVWDDDYIHMERQAFVEIGPDNVGSFQFGLVRGELDGYVEAAEGDPFDDRRDTEQLASEAVSDRFIFGSS